MQTPEFATVRRFQAHSLGEAFRRAADWLDEPRQRPVVIESVNHVQLPRAPGGSELLSVFFTCSEPAPHNESPDADECTWSSVAHAILDELDVGYAPTGRQLSDRHTEAGQWILLAHAVQMVKAIVQGPQKALDPPKGRDTVSDAVDVDRLHRAGVAWFGEIISHFGGPEILADKRYVIRTVAVRVALASLGNAFYSQDPTAIANARAVLTDVDWTVSEAWQNIGGYVEVTDEGPHMTAGSGKASITRAVQAMKPDTELGRSVRRRE